ncbi:MAG TPA: DUF4350 domain-containing protein [Candidatus Eisenbacteria bacterium]
MAPRPALALSFALVAAPLPAGPARAQQVADSTFDTRVARPAYTATHPRVLFDEAHRNFHTTTGRYRPFAELISNDGYRVTPNAAPFSARVLDRCEVLVIANAAGAGWDSDSGVVQPAFMSDECDAVRDWVRGGGSLLLIADHAPFGTSAQALAQRFGVSMSTGYTIDSTHADPESRQPGNLVYSRDNGLLGDHAITRGRDSTESIRRVIAFTGQSLAGPAGSVAFMKLGDQALDLPLRTFAAARSWSMARSAATPAAGRAQGVAFAFGKGRVVVLGEAAMLSAQMIVMPGRPTLRMGMNRAGIDNRQLALNIMHWLSGALN